MGAHITQECSAHPIVVAGLIACIIQQVNIYLHAQVTMFSLAMICLTVSILACISVLIAIHPTPVTTNLEEGRMKSRASSLASTLQARKLLMFVLIHYHMTNFTSYFGM